jgi:hypothetical protein
VALDELWVLADEQWAERLLDQVIDGLPTHGPGVRVTDAGVAVVGVDPHQNIFPST